MSQDFAHNATAYDGTVTGAVQRLRGVYSSVDIPKGTAISFVPARHVMHRSEFNRSEIWPSLAPLSPVATNHTRTVDLSVGEKRYILLRDHPVFLTHHALPCSCCLRAQQPPLVLAALSVRSLISPPPAQLSAPPAASACAPSCNLPPAYEGSALTWGVEKLQVRMGQVAAVCSCVAFDAAAAGSGRSCLGALRP